MGGCGRVFSKTRYPSPPASKHWETWDVPPPRRNNDRKSELAPLKKILLVARKIAEGVDDDVGHWERGKGTCDMIRTRITVARMACKFKDWIIQTGAVQIPGVAKRFTGQYKEVLAE